MKIIFSFLAFLFCLPVFGQVKVDRSQAPSPGPAPTIHIGDPQSFTTKNGIRVFVVEDHKVPEVTVSLVLKRDPILEKDKVGYVSMAGAMMRRGTTTKTKAELDEEIDFLGGRVNTGSSSASASSLSKNFKEIFTIFSDVILHPAFQEEELEKVRKRTLSSLQSEEDDPDAILDHVVRVANYGKEHPYGENETKETISRIQVSDLKEYYQTYWKPNIAYMAFVGDITPAEAENLVNQYLGSWEKGEVPKHQYKESKKPDTTQIYLVDRPSAVQTNIEITDPIQLKPGAPNFFAASTMNQILGGGSSGWLFQDLREKYGFTYGAYSRLSSDPVVGQVSAFADVRTEVTDSSLERFMVQLHKIRDQEVSQDKLDSVKNVISGNFALSLERPAQIANFAINIARYNLPKDYYRNYLKNIDAVSAEDIRQVANQFITPDQSNIVLVGNAKAFAQDLEKYGEVHEVDIYGNPVAAPEKPQAAPDDVTAEKVIQNYLQVIGGPSSLQKVKDLKIEAKSEMQGMEVQITQSYLLPDKYALVIGLPGGTMELAKIVINGDQITGQQLGKTLSIPNQMKGLVQALGNPFPERNLLGGSYTLALKGIESIDGDKVYAVAATDEDGNIVTYYYDTQDGFKKRIATSIEDTEGFIDYGDYQEKEGIMIPSKMKLNAGPLKASLDYENIEINQGIDQTIFE